MLKMDTTELDDVAEDLYRLQLSIKGASQDGLKKVGRFVEGEQKDRCPFGPTKSQAQAAGQSFVKGSAPGTLESSIGIRMGSDYVEVGVLYGGGQKYGARINYDTYKLGPGSVAKDGTTSVDVGRLFVERGYEENEDEVMKIFQMPIDKKIVKFNRS